MPAPEPTPPDAPSRPPDRLPPALADKLVVERRLPPWYRRFQVRPVATGVVIAVGAALATGLTVVTRWHDERLAELAAQRPALERFLASPEFAAFVQQLDRELVAAINFVAARPQEARAAFPAVATRETERRELPWTHEVLPLPIPFAAQPERVAAAGRELGALLARRGFVCDEPTRAAARRLFLGRLSPHADLYLRRQQGPGFRAVALDRSLQDTALAAFAARHGPGFTIADTERLFSFYAAVGPLLWRTLEQTASPLAAPPATRPAAGR